LPAVTVPLDGVGVTIVAGRQCENVLYSIMEMSNCL